MKLEKQSIRLLNLISKNSESNIQINDGRRDGQELEMKSQDEIIGALTSPKIPLILTIPRSKEENEEYNSLNTNFSNRINEIEESAMASSAIAKDDKVVDIEDEDLNENKKRVVKNQGSRDNPDRV
ncbi:uncharacterized protein OCT59_028550 [Rhizophagus irregularis]|uniref:Uncharacterized protein n=1 Tax=Rhizophagus irregularis (strain DAOM 181602 / DAOM 197198 / MUCL 43194) TaxID=747089 RepID=A0A2P4Q619_RHIID|nr:hypothetical protein GLOIN_2v1874621 [Rhizophagus irregularis DAOM 181602=DAOM 197198]POG73096.1 hypothetical protein GLOIN_2v1874621 [Rhizophagus irregularis DAOM 181602=DAOM 197198]UZO08292.1 hypothetical protein OCT59_028550 [Rhizophagus irregularis]|eukprot:XP_025179962.1 hypothetical protein GLOIN_2v1874621 [Rhizophagus irregularis DAOM 181602=DAOM 197198]